MRHTLTLLFILFSSITFAQGGAMADLKFEEAEIAFNDGNYSGAIAKLDEFDKTYGKVSEKSLYLRIIAQDNIIDYMAKAESDDMLKFQKRVNAFLKAFEQEGVTDKYREVYYISQKINTALLIKKWSSETEYLEGYKAFEAEDYEKAHKFFLQGEKKGNALAMTSLASQYITGSGVEIDYAKAFDYLLSASKLGEPTSLCLLGTFYYGGDRGVAQDSKEAYNLFKKSGDMGFSQALVFLGAMNEKGEGVVQNYHDAKYWYNKGALKGDGDAMFKLGELYHDGNGVTKDLVKALHWYKKSAEAETSMHMFNLQAMNRVGVMYNKGEGVAKDYSIALSWYQKAAEKGYDRAEYNIGNAYFYGLAVDKNYEEAISWYQKAASGTDTALVKEAKKAIGDCYFNLGNDYYYAQNYTDAMKNYKKAYDYGNRNGNLRIVEMYRKGLGTAKDKDQAKIWEKK